jgi:peptidoglycan endopeptidase LytE
MITTLIALNLYIKPVIIKTTDWTTQPIQITEIKALEKQKENEDTKKPLQSAQSEDLSTDEGILEYIAKTFAEAGEEARQVATCESRLNPRAVSPDGIYHGIFQFDEPTWNSNADGISWNERYNAKINIDIAYRTYQKRGWQPWGCQP